jgi:hypothetical protein
MVDVNLVERTLSAYPGRISSVISLPRSKGCEKCSRFGYETKDLENIKNDLLENPMVTAIFIDEIGLCNSWKNYAEIVKWAKNNNLSVGVGTCGVSIEEVENVISSNSVEFIRIFIRAKDVKDREHIEKVKKSIGRVRASGIKYEICLGVDGDMDIGLIKNMYHDFSPCSNFVVEAMHKLDYKQKENIIGLASDNSNIILRLWH